MTTSSLCNLNVDTLFEQHSIAEIDIIQKKVQAVVEQKREELRLMVGERYRDLLHAADTIAAMQGSSDVLIKQIDAIMGNCRTLNEQQLIGFKTKDDSTTDQLLKNRKTNKELNTYFSTIIQIKILTLLPDLIWTHIDEQQFYCATELLIFSRHISTGLQLDANNPLMQHLPIAKKQWELLKCFHSTIKQKIVNALERETLSSEVAVDCILSLLLLEKSGINSIIRSFMQLRCNAYATCLKEQTNSEDGERRLVKDRILASLNVLYGTMVLLEKCMVDNGLLHRKLSDYADPQLPPTIALLQNKYSLHTHLLPDIIANYRPKFEKQNIDGKQISDAVEQFLSDTKTIAQVELKSLFSLVDSMQTIQEIKQKATHTKSNLKFTLLKEKFQLHQYLDFFDMEYIPQINQRVRDIIHNSWAKAMRRTLEKIIDVQSITGSSAQQTNTTNLWLEESEDLPLSLAVALSDDDKVKKLLMKTKGFNDDAISICTDFDRDLATIINELNILIEDQATRNEDKVNLIEFLRETSEMQLHDFLSQMKSFKANNANENDVLLLLVRICAALLELCPHLRVCFNHKTSWRQELGHNANSLLQSNGIEHWQRISQLFEEEILNFWGQIIDNILAEKNCRHFMPTKITSNVMLEDFANWENVTLEQKDESGNTVNSNFRIPNQPNISLQSYLFSLTTFLNEIVPQTLPPKIVQVFNHKLLLQLVAYYEEVSLDVQNSAASQSISLQYHFDLKFLQSIFVTATPNKRHLNEEFLKLQNTFKQNIDPFDFELFSDNINANVKISIARLSNQLGLLLPANTSAALASSLLAPSQDRDPNILNLSACGSTSLWFPLLPIVTPGKTQEGNVISHDKKNNLIFKSTSTPSPTTTTTASSRKSGHDASKSKSTGASFFGAMSQDWFR